MIWTQRIAGAVIIQMIVDGMMTMMSPFPIILLAGKETNDSIARESKGKRRWMNTPRRQQHKIIRGAKHSVPSFLVPSSFQRNWLN